MMQRKHFLIAPLAASLMLVSCGGDKTEGGDDMSGEDTLKTETHTEQITETFFQVPSPGEMLTFIKMVGGKNNKNVSFLNSPENQKNYTDTKLKALNFGIYSCDLSYCSIFEIGSEALKYFKVVKQLGDQIGVSSAIQPEVLKRLEGNLGNPDSLSVITDDVYFTSFETLEQGKQGPTLSLVVSGGWIESLFIATSLAKYDAKSPVVERLADQKYTLDNLIEFLKKYESDANVASVLTQFTELQAEFNKIGEKEVDAAKSGDKSKTVLGGGKELDITEAQYTAIVDKIKAIRNSYTLTK
ncbi:MAG: hypothetical protein K0R26_2967 [Bacteroidota bacterium]|jgi:hypothetical protein|nr:hypothetical protein [Bacteroidota bacterium]